MMEVVVTDKITLVDMACDMIEHKEILLKQACEVEQEFKLIQSRMTESELEELKERMV